MKKNEKRKSIWRWEWGHEYRSRIGSLTAEALITLFILVAYKLAKSFFFRGAAAVMRLPAWFYAFLGVDALTETGNFLFYLAYTLMLINAWNIWKDCEYVVRGMDREEHSGSVYLMCGQWFSRDQMAWGKWSWNAAALAVRQILLYIWALLLALIGSFNREQRIKAAGTLAGSFCISFAVMLFFMSISFLHAVHHRRGPDGDAASFRSTLFFAPLLLGNLYKVRDLLFAVLALLGRTVPQRASDVFAWLNGLYWLSPISWTNPFHGKAAWIVCLQCFLCVGGSVCSVALGLREYRKKEFFS